MPCRRAAGVLVIYRGMRLKARRWSRIIMPGALPLWLPPRGSCRLLRCACAGSALLRGRLHAGARLPARRRSGRRCRLWRCGAAGRQVIHKRRCLRFFSPGNDGGNAAVIHAGWRLSPLVRRRVFPTVYRALRHALGRSLFLRIYWPLGPFLLCHAHASFPDIVFGPGAARLLGCIQAFAAICGASFSHHSARAPIPFSNAAISS